MNRPMIKHNKDEILRNLTEARRNYRDNKDKISEMNLLLWVEEASRFIAELSSESELKIADELAPPEQKPETFAPEGSAEWAWQMSKRGHLIIHRDMHYPIRPPLVGSIEEWCEYHEQDGWEIYDGDLPRYKVGDWVECDGRPYRIAKIGERTWNGDETINLEDANGRRTIAGIGELRKLDPSEVRVKITLEGTVSKHLPYPEIYFYIHTPYTVKLIPFEGIDPETRKLVKSLIKAQDDE